MKTEKILQIFVGIFLLALELECGKSDHVHLKIHVPDLVHKHKHVKTKYVHVFHPKVIHSDHHSSLQFLHRHDPNIGLINGGYPQPLLNLNPSQEYHINEEDFFKWRREQQRRVVDKRRHQLQQQNKRNDDDYEEKVAVEEEEEEEDQPDFNDELFKKQKSNTASSSSYRNGFKHKNHNYLKSNYKNSRPNFRTSIEDETAKKYRVYGVSNVDAESSNIEPQYLSLDPTAIDPEYYTTLPKNVKNSSNYDDIYSGLLAKKYNKEITEKSKLLADINYSRKQQTKNSNQRKGQE